MVLFVDPGEIRAVSGGDCWICYDSENTDRLIQPCDCKGGMELVHHDCLKKWLLEVRIIYVGYP